MKFIASLITALLLSTPLAAHENRFESVVLKVHDADTIHAQISVGMGLVLSRESIRLYGIDAPELYGQNADHGRVGAEWLRQQIDGRDVTLEIFGRDKYGRLLAVVWLDGRNLNRELVERGFAVVYNP